MGEWIERKLGDIGKTYGGLSGKKKDDFGKGKNYIPYMNVFSNEIIDINFLDKVAISTSEKQNTVLKGDILFTTSSETQKEVGMTSVLDRDIGEVYLNSFCFGFRPSKENLILPIFIAYLLREEGIRKQIIFNGQGSTRYNISKKGILKNVTLKFPDSKKEQSTIAKVLTTVDQAIDQTEKLIAKYEKIKTGLMQDLLTKGIDEQGNIRSEETHEFKDSVDKNLKIPIKWRSLKMKDISVVNQGLQIAISKRFKNEGPKRYIYITIQFLNSPNKYIEYIENPTDSVIVHEDDILFTRTGNTGQIITNVKGVFHNNFFKVAFDDSKVEKDFLYYFLNWEPIQALIKDLSGTTTIPDMKHSDFYSLPIFLPDKEEQKLIVKNLNQIYDHIDLENKKLIKLRSQKASLMQDLLTGKVSVEPLMTKEVAIV